MDNPYAPPTNEGPRFEFGSSGNSTGGKLTLLQILFSFEGRIPRQVYWLASLVSLFVFYAGAFLIGMMGGALRLSESALTILVIPEIILFFWVALAIQVKRWHDLNKSGWWIFSAFIPCIGGILQFIECGCTRGTVGLNEYGPDPTDEY